jgi:cytochrome c oxidase subunit 2
VESLPLMLESASTQADRFEPLFWFIVVATGGASLLVFALLGYFCAAYRRSATTGSTPRILGSHRLELFWTVTPLLIFLGMYVWGAIVYDAAMPHSAPKDAMRVNVIGKQWMWKAQYEPGGQRVIVGGNQNNMTELERSRIGALVLPVNKPVHLSFISEDVIHDFGIPAFRSKIDVVPGRYVETWYHPTKEGEYHVFCDQYCGTLHSQMVGKVRVVSQDRFDAFLRGLTDDQAKGTGGAVDGSSGHKGQQLFRELQCINCHTNNSQAKAPVLEELYMQDVTLTDGRTVKADKDYIRESIVNPQKHVVMGWGRAPDGGSIMPNYVVGPTTDARRATISAGDLEEVVAYIQGLKKNGTIPPTQHSPTPANAPGNPAQPTTGSKP